MASEFHSRTGHEKFTEMCALAASAGLTASELAELKLHLQNCKACQERLSQYRALGTQGLAALAECDSRHQESYQWDDAASWKKLVARLHSDQDSGANRTEGAGAPRSSWFRRIRMRWFGRTRDNKQ